MHILKMFSSNKYVSFTPLSSIECVCVRVKTPLAREFTYSTWAKKKKIVKTRRLEEGKLLQ